ncbi:MAG: cob(I)yrinic acid a,c-diamide adenosyltransferase [Lewinella sp.]|nr:cob(I)yrinic acid a,c-diamide adenosyltransferase [Lewinella sp.]
MKIYTKTGDAGETGLFGGQRLPKDDIRIEAYGTVDELNAVIGLLLDQVTDEPSRATLLTVQRRLFTIGAHLATAPEQLTTALDILPGDIELLEKEMDRMEADLPPLRHFILPGGHPAVSHAHLARTVCRRAERRVVTLAREAEVEPIVIRFLNRLSDYCFMLGRHLARLEGAEEVTWHPR